MLFLLVFLMFLICRWFFIFFYCIKECEYYPLITIEFIFAILVFLTNILIYWSIETFLKNKHKNKKNKQSNIFETD